MEFDAALLVPEERLSLADAFVDVGYFIHFASNRTEGTAQEIRRRVYGG
ncbi:MAG: hypothetical protein IPN18_15035 [Ignavibacteriales bacterium]|nr:hypothetical protein [Ignavibacteriales bacterium]